MTAHDQISQRSFVFKVDAVDFYWKCVESGCFWVDYPVEVDSMWTVFFTK